MADEELLKLELMTMIVSYIINPRPCVGGRRVIVVDLCVCVCVCPSVRPLFFSKTTGIKRGYVIK